MEPARKTVILGLDGATYDLVLPYIRQGVLPEFGHLLAEGTWGELRSTTPPTTPPAWSSCITGKNPGKHGIFDFRDSPLRDPSRPLIRAHSVRGAKIWDILAHHGRRSGVLNLPILFPPEPIQGFMVTGMMTPGPESDYAHPEGLKRRLLDAIGDYVVNIDIPRYEVEELDDALAFFRDMKHCFRKRTEAMRFLWANEPWDLFFVVFIVTDRIGHLFWKYLDEGSRFYGHPNAPRIREEIVECYRMLDGMIAWVRRQLDERTDLIVMSDHGFGTTKAWINVNTWLKDLGLLKVHPGAWARKRLFYRAMALNESPAVRGLVPRGLQRAIRKRIRSGRSTMESARSDIEAAIDWDSTRAFFASIPCQGIYVNVRGDGLPGRVEPGSGEHDEIRKLLKEKLLDLRDPATGEKVVDAVYEREELYAGEETGYAPDVLFVAKDYSYLGRQILGGSEWIRTSETTPNGFHRSNGILCLRGPNFLRGQRIEGASIMDVAPTLLASLGLPVPDDMDGRVLTEAFDLEFLEEHPVLYEPPIEVGAQAKGEGYTESETKEIEERLRGLGYIE